MNLVIALPGSCSTYRVMEPKKYPAYALPLYTANNRHLIISGMGGENAAKATQYLIDHSQEKPTLAKPGNCRSWQFGKGQDLFGWASYKSRQA